MKESTKIGEESISEDNLQRSLDSIHLEWVNIRETSEHRSSPDTFSRYKILEYYFLIGTREKSIIIQEIDKLKLELQRVHEVSAGSPD